MKPLAEIEGLFFGYQTEPLFQDLTLRVNEGEFLGIVGPNGSGKSTLIKIILGLIRPQEGRVALFGEEVSAFRGWRQVGYLSQQATSFNSGFPATVAEVVEAGLLEGKSFFKPWVKIDKEAVADALDLVGLAGFEKAVIGELSGGQQQRVFLARLLVRKPRLIFLDEPTTGLDPQGYHQLAELLARLNKEAGFTIVVVTHQLSCMVQHFSRLVYLEEGKLLSYQPFEFLARCQYA